MSRCTRLALLLLLGALVLAAPAQATVRHGSGTDPKGDVAIPGQDVVALAASADDSGTAGVAVGLAAPPTSATWIVGQIGTRQPDGSCGEPYVLFFGKPSTGQAEFGHDPSYSAATMKVDGATISLLATDPGQLAKPFDCAAAGTSTSASTAALIDRTDTPVTLASDPPPPAPAPAPTPPPPPAPAPAPPPTPLPPPTPPPGPKAKLTVSLTGVPGRIRRNRALRLKLVVSNDGTTPTGRISLTPPRARGLSVRGLPRRIASLKPGRHRTVVLKVRLTRRARTTTRVQVRARGSRAHGASTVLLRIGRAKGGRGGTGPAPAAKNPLVGTYWWRTVYHPDHAWDNRALIFVDATHVYSGFPAGGIPTTCTTPPAKPAEEIDKRDGCLNYSFDPASGAITIAEKTGSFKDGKLTLDDERYEPTQIGAAGARLAFTDHEHVAFTGICGAFSTCTITHDYLSLEPDGQFSLGTSTTTTESGQYDFFQGGKYPADQHGTYEIRAGGTIHLIFADGSSRDRLFAVLTNEKTGQPDPLGAGVLLGEDNFYPDASP